MRQSLFFCHSQALLWLGVAACGHDPVSPLPTILSTDATAYVATPGAPIGAGREYSLTVIARFTNTSPYTVMLARCYEDAPYPIYGVQHLGGSEVAAYDPGWDCVGGYYFRVAPGATRSDTLSVRAPWGIDGYTGVPMGVFEGRFRLTYEIYGCRDQTPGCTQPVYATSYSNVFTIRRGA